MKTVRTKMSNSNYPGDYKEIFKNYLLKNEMIEKYNSDENNILKGKKNENYK